MEVLFKWIGGATWLLDVGDVRIGCDPVLCPKGTVQDYFWFKARRRDAPVFDEADLAAVDLWLLTHPHEDHLDAQGIARITDTAQVIARANVLPLIPAHPPDRVRTLAWGERAEQTFGDLQVTVEAIPAIHGVNPLTALLAGGVNGYYLTLRQGAARCHVYVTSDTVLKRRVLEAVRGRPVDILVPNMGAARQGSWMMTLTLSSKMLQKMVAALRPRWIVPVHFHTFDHYVEPIDKVKAWADDSMVILAPGESTTLSVPASIQGV